MSGGIGHLPIAGVALKQIRAKRSGLPLSPLRDGIVLRPLSDRPSPDSEEPGELRIGLKPQGGLDCSLGHVHGRQSSSLDPRSVKHSSLWRGYGSRPMDTMAERLKRALNLRDATPADLVAQKVLSKAGVYFILDGTTKADTIRSSTVDKLAKALRVNRDWLQYGKGPIEGPTEAADEPDWDDVLGYAQSVGLGRGAEAQEYAETHSLKFRTESLRRKGLRPSNLAVMYGDGDSMEPRIRKGDAILFDTGDVRPQDGLIFVVQWRDEIYAKRCEIIDDVVYFRADNPAGDHNWRKPKRMDAKRDPVHILGRVRWIGSWE